MKTVSKLKIASIIVLCLVAPHVSFAGHTNPLLAAELSGRQQVDSRGDRNGRGFAYVFGIDGDPTTLCYTLVVNRIQLVPVEDGMAAHVHEGRRGENGPIIAVLAGPEDGTAADCLTEGEPGKFPEHDVAGSGIVQEILANPESYYVNVHNPKFPAGAIRGQLSEAIGYAKRPPKNGKHGRGHKH